MDSGIDISVPPSPGGMRRRIENPVGIRNGTATVSAEAGRRTKVSHWTMGLRRDARTGEA